MFLSRFAEFHFRPLLLLFLTAFAAAIPSFAQTPNVDSEEQIMIRMINEYRAKKGLGRLTVSISLTRAADWMSTDMSTKNYFSHKDSLGRDPFARMTAFGYKYPTTKGENLAAGYNDAARTFSQWKNSSSHNAAMLNGAFKVIGISRVYGQHSEYKWYWSTDFGGFVDATFEGPGPGLERKLRVLNSANDFQSVAPDAIATTYGTQMTGVALSATSFPLPNSLAGIALTVNEQSNPEICIKPFNFPFLVLINR